jgi:hypothetical protein
MFDRVTVLELIDRAFEDQRFCEACGEPTILRNDGDAVILECSDIGRYSSPDRELPHAPHAANRHRSFRRPRRLTRDEVRQRRSMARRTPNATRIAPIVASKARLTRGRRRTWPTRATAVA